MSSLVFTTVQCNVSAVGKMLNIAHFQHIGEGRKVVAFPKKQTIFTEGDTAAWYGQCR